MNLNTYMLTINITTHYLILFKLKANAVLTYTIGLIPFIVSIARSQRSHYVLIRYNSQIIIFLYMYYFHIYIHASKITWHL